MVAPTRQDSAISLPVLRFLNKAITLRKTFGDLDAILSFFLLDLLVNN